MPTRQMFAIITHPNYQSVVIFRRSYSQVTKNLSVRNMTVTCDFTRLKYTCVLIPQMIETLTAAKLQVSSVFKAVINTDD